METDVIRHATAIVFVNAQTSDRVMRKYPDAWREGASPRSTRARGFQPSG
jgi:hypothetical protein